jgi:hypothetical protein
MKDTVERTLGVVLFSRAKSHSNPVFQHGIQAFLTRYSSMC